MRKDTSIVDFFNNERWTQLTDNTKCFVKYHIFTTCNNCCFHSSCEEKCTLEYIISQNMNVVVFLGFALTTTFCLQERLHIWNNISIIFTKLGIVLSMLQIAKRAVKHFNLLTFRIASIAKCNPARFVAWFQGNVLSFIISII